ncbi:TonB-dependent receptor domain-containing protein [Sphingosinicella sp. BN140058]|uniref:TonB-dependent receptor domain-containing protein n=1 Tax=Sphingosinicella sp. BN140058 TaxID=1892855 RepID=UPI001011D7B6|nr:TonB-dependent receptor [Sphingosinicella sp. BN140058]QAY77425.1 TonB-dependent receptor [Sphingosinicella sp. BN140058]
MRKLFLLLSVAPVALAAPAMAEVATAGAVEQSGAEAPADSGAAKEVFSTGVAKGRDRLDSATSTSSLREAEIVKLGARSVADILRDIPGIRAEAANGEGNANITIRGLPLASSGAKFLQLQEDGLPVFEFGDISFATADTFLRADLNLAAVEAIRGGSASTFASNSPGGIVNFISKTGETEGGNVEVTAGLDYEQYRVDFDYGAKLSETVRFHIGGFYRLGEGVRHTGFNATEGGQVKFNVTKEFDGGYVRLYGKYLNDRSPSYDTVPLAVTGTNSDPEYKNVAGFDARHDTLYSRNYQDNLTLDGNNNVRSDDMRQHAIAKTIGLEGKFELAGWDVTERFRFANMSGHYIGIAYAGFMPAAVLPMAFGGPGATAFFANGGNVGQSIGNPMTLNENGLAALLMVANTDLNSVNNVTNDIRASRVWEIGRGDLTTTAGFYSSHQTIDTDWLWSTVFSDIADNGDSHLLDIVTATGAKITQDGVFQYGGLGGGLRRSYDLGYTTNAPFGSINYHIGKIAIGGSLRYDFGSAKGSVQGAELGGGRIGLAPRDMNGDGVISIAEQQVSVLPLSTPAPLDYDYDYLSYSAGINFRIAEPLAVFARYSKGGRANADRLLFSPVIGGDGDILYPQLAVDNVKQAEAGVKYRKGGLTLNVTGFWAKAAETNIDTTNGQPIVRDYKAMGAEFEGGFRKGPVSLTAGATYTDAEILSDFVNPAIEGNVPHHQAKLIFQATPQYSTDRFSIGAVFIGTTGSYATDDNLLKVPGYVTTNAFVQFRPTDRVTLSVNANNLFDVLAITAIDDPTVPAGGVARAHVLTGRTVSTSVRFSF